MSTSRFRPARSSPSSARAAAASRPSSASSPACNRSTPAPWPLDGVDRTTTPPHRRGVGLMFQDHVLFPHLDVGANVAFGLRMQGLAASATRPRVAELLTLVGLPGTEARAIQSLSGGEQQRVALARSLAPAPSVLLLDEPLGALDRPLRERLVDELSGLFAAPRPDGRGGHPRSAGGVRARRPAGGDRCRSHPPDRCPRRGLGRAAHERGGPAARVHQHRSRPCRGRPAADPLGRPGSGPRVRWRPCSCDRTACGRTPAVPSRAPWSGGPSRARTRAFGSPSPTRRTSTWRSRTARWRSLPSGPRSVSGSPLRPCGHCRADLGPGAIHGGGSRRSPGGTYDAPGSTPVCDLRCRPLLPCPAATSPLSPSRSWPAWRCASRPRSRRRTRRPTPPPRRPPRRPSRSRPVRPPPPSLIRAWGRSCPRSRYRWCPTRFRRGRWSPVCTPSKPGA